MLIFVEITKFLAIKKFFLDFPQTDFRCIAVNCRNRHKAGSKNFFGKKSAMHGIWLRQAPSEGGSPPSDTFLASAALSDFCLIK